MPTPKLNADQLKSLTDTLRDLQSTLRQQVTDDFAGTETVDLDQQSFGRVSRVDALQQQQMALAGRQQLEARFRQVSVALARVESGDYGYCEHCDEAIGFPRLEAQPWVGLCLTCQSVTEK